MAKKSTQKFKYLRTKIAFKIFKGLSLKQLKQLFLEGVSLT